MQSARPDLTWQPLYKIGGISAWVFVAMVLVPVILVFTAPVPPTEGRALLVYIADHKAVYLVQLICFVGLGIPALIAFAAMAVALAGVNKGLAAIGGLLGVASEIIALAVGSSPQSLHGGLVLLSNDYASATSDAERDSLVSAANALVAIANGMPWAGILTAAGILVLSWVMLPAGSFGRALAIVGIATGALGIVSEALRPMIGSAYLLYGMLLPVWFGWVGVTLLRVPRRSVDAAASSAS